MTDSRIETPGIARSAVIATALIALSPLTLAMYGPSMPAMAAAFGTDPAGVQHSLTVYLVAFGLAQLVYGPLADRFGRRTVVTGGLLLFLAGCLAGGLARTLDVMLLARVLEGVGACGGSAASRAFVRDRHEGRAAARVFAFVGMGLALAPAAGPLIAGYLQRDHGWQAMFVLLGGLALLLLLLVRLAMPETLPMVERRALRPRVLLATYGAILADRSFVGPALLLALSGAGTFYYVALAPFVLIDQLGVPPERFGKLMPLLMVAYLAASGLAALLAGVLATGRLVALGCAVSLAGALALYLVLRAGATVETVIAPLMVWMAGIALLTPGVTAAALGPFTRHTGSAAAVLGFLQALGSGLGSLAAALTAAEALGLAPLVLLAAGALLAWLLAPRPALRATG